ncbi:universal stress protein [Devosia sp.]|uniref:universal stress protein n=1 Tax=Devosia sp. TaxID=1871048 RepID=UPI00326436FC
MLTDIFVPLLTYPDVASDDAIGSALRFTNGFAAGVEFCAFEIDIPKISYSFGADMIDFSGMIADAEQQSHKHATRLLELAATAKSAVAMTTSRVRLHEVNVGHAASTMAQLRDLSIVQLPHNSESQRDLAESLIFGSGRPVVVLPKPGERSWTNDHIAIAWDGSKAASSAVHDAMGLLLKARTVKMLTAFDDKAIGEKSVAGLHDYLSRHGIEAEHRDLNSAGISIGTCLQDGAIDNGAGLLVMGAFGHSRVREFILGGATRAVLLDVRLPVFFSH